MTRRAIWTKRGGPYHLRLEWALWGSVALSSNLRFRGHCDHQRQKPPSGWRGLGDPAGPRSDRWQAVGREHTGDRLGTLALSGPRCSAHGQPDGGFEGRGEKRSVESPLLRLRRPGGKPPADGIWRMRSGRRQKGLAPMLVLDLGRHAMLWIGQTFLRIPQMMGDEF